MDRYEFKEEIGSGKFGVVSLYYDTQCQCNVAVKAINVPNKFDGFPSSILREVSILKELDHENIVKLLDVQVDGTLMYLVFEFLDCDLSSIMANLTPSQIKGIMYGLLSGLNYLHASMTIHRDFCPTNVLVKKNMDEFGSASAYTIKIADFGLSRYTSTEKEVYTHTDCTYEYTAPEQLLRAPSYSTPIDIWAAGCMFAEMVKRGELLFEDNRELCSIAHISSVLGVPNDEIWPGLSEFAPAFRSLASECSKQGLETNVKGLDADGLDLLTKMLVWDPKERITSYEALQHRYFSDLSSGKAI